MVDELLILLLPGCADMVERCVFWSAYGYALEPMFLILLYELVIKGR